MTLPTSQQEPGGRAAGGARHPPVRAACCHHPEHSPVDRELGHDVVVLAHLVEHPGTERLHVEVHRGLTVVDPQLRLDRGHHDDSLPVVPAQRSTKELTCT